MQYINTDHFHFSVQSTLHQKELFGNNNTEYYKIHIK